jgi:hypothetical protein
MAGFRIEGNTSGNVAEVDANNNFKTTLPVYPAQAGFALLAGEIGSTGDLYGRLVEPIRTSAQGRLSVGEPVCLMNEVFSYTVLNTSIFGGAATTNSITVAGGTLNLVSSTTASAVASIRTYAFFPFQADFATYCTADMSLAVAAQNNTVIELGFGQMTGVAAPTDGAFFRYDATATLKAVLTNNGTEYTQPITPQPSSGVMHKYKVIVENDRVLYYIDGALVAINAAPTGLGMPLYAQSCPFFFRNYNTASVPAAANTAKLGYVYVGVQDAIGMGRLMADNAASAGRMGCQLQPGSAVSGSTALLTNSMAAGAGVALTNTTAAAGLGLGGQFSVLPTLAAGTDGIVDFYTNPAATAGVPGKNLYIKGVRVQGAVTTLLAGGPVLYEYALAIGGNQVVGTFLTAAETALGVKAARRIPLGFENFIVTAPVGTIGASVYMPLNSTLTLYPGESIALTAKNLGVVTTAGVITIAVTFDSYWEI